MSRILSAVAWPYANGPRHIGHVAGFGVLWVAKFFVLDRVLFAATPEEHLEPPPLL